MDVEKTVQALEKNGFKARYFETAALACEAVASELRDRTVGIGGSMTVKEMGLYDKLIENNTVYWHWITNPDETRAKASTAQVYICSANAISQTGEIVNIDGTGNRVASALYGHERVIIIAGINKIAENLDAAIFRARNVAAPLNAKRMNRKTPCALSEPMRCHDCSSPDRICNGMTITMRKLRGVGEMEVVIVGEKLGY